MTSLKLISATDTQYSKSLLVSLNEQRNSGLYCDVTVIVENRAFKAHKNILSASSSYFCQLFAMAGQVVELNFIKAEIFEEILNYIYSSKIVRVRADAIEELIRSGHTLGVKFISNLDHLLTQVKSLSDLPKDVAEGNSSSGQKGSDLMPVITETFTLSADKFMHVEDSQSKKEDSDDDVLFVSTRGPQNKDVSTSTLKSNGSDLYLNGKDNWEEGPLKPHKPQEAEKSIANALSIDKDKVPRCNTPMKVQPDSATQDTAMEEEFPFTSTQVNGSPKETQLNSQFYSEVIGVQKKQVTTVSESSERPGEFKIKLSDVRSGSSPETINDSETEGEGSNSDGEELFPASSVDDKADGGYMQAQENSLMPMCQSFPSYKGKQRARKGPNDHYQLVMDGKTFYVCVVCKRSYACLTSLRRHFNVHSWEKKYPCRYCDKVFALAEYRTKHEIHHTGERRYQCLLCGTSFITYQLLSNHCKQVHQQDPSGKRENDVDNKLYRLLPCRTLELKTSVHVSEDPDTIPMINENGMVYHIKPTQEPSTRPVGRPRNKPLNWEDIFPEPGKQSYSETYVNPQQGTSEFEFVIPESY